MRRHNIQFVPAMQTVLGAEGSTILDLAGEAGVYTGSQCGGKGTCGKCRVRVMEGDVSPFSPVESQFISDSDRSLGYRLACMTRVSGNATVLVPGQHVSSIGETKKTFATRTTNTDPAIKSYPVNLGRKSPSRSDPLKSILDHLRKKGLPEISIDPGVRETLQETAECAHGTVTVIIWMDREIIAALPGRHESCFGLAVDIGTTVVAVYLCELRSGEVVGSGSTTNPQVLFGPDIMSRISYSVAHPGEGAKRMQRELISSINELIAQLTAAYRLVPETIMDLTIVGNTVMHHIFLGITPDNLGLWPFTPSVKGSVDVKAKDLGLSVNPGAYAHVLPVEAGFVGADNVGVLLSQEPYNRDEMSLIIDLGTNGEIVLGNREGLLCCSCATGPAFEGAHISCGMRALPGAIEKIRIHPETLEVDYAVIGNTLPSGLCGSGIIDALAGLLTAGIIGENGAFSRKIGNPRIKKGKSGVMEFVLVWREKTATGRDIVITQKDVRQVQLAKAALHAGCKVLMRRMGLDRVPRIMIAGSFGMHIDKESALTIGLFPWCKPENIESVGNAAGHGAYLALVNKAKREEAGRIARSVTHIELALEEGFQEEFMKSLAMRQG